MFVQPVGGLVTWKSFYDLAIAQGGRLPGAGGEARGVRGDRGDRGGVGRAQGGVERGERARVF